MNDWYITAYEPIRDVTGDVIGILYVGMLEAPYSDVRRRTTILFLSIALGGTIVAVGLSYLVSSRVTDTRQEARPGLPRGGRRESRHPGHHRSDRELAELADAFNSMAAALQTRDEKLKGVRDEARSWSRSVSP